MDYEREIMENCYLEEDLEIISEEFWKLNLGDSTIAVTGATGLLGSLIVRGALRYNERYEEKISIIAIVRNLEKAKKLFGCPKNMRFICQDITTPLEEFECDYIVHTANSTSSKTFITNPVEVIDSIYTGSRQILEFSRKMCVKGAVYLSSMEVFGQVESNSRISEDELGYLDIHNVRSCYSEGKRLVECMCEAYAQEYSVPIRVARLAQTFGAGISENENRVFAQFARSALNDEAIVLHTTGESMGNYVYTRDAVKAILRLLVSGKPGAAYTVVNESTTMTIREMAQLVATVVSSGRSKVEFDIPVNNQYGYAPSTGMRLSSDALRELGWKPEVDLPEMYSRMLPDLVSKS